VGQDGRNGSTSEVPVSVRFAAESDLPRIMEIERLSFPARKQWDYGDFQEAMKDLFFVFVDGEISGFLIAHCWGKENKGIILRVAVHPGCRGRGVATRLIESAIGVFRERDIREVEIDVEIVKRGAIQLYERVGFRIIRGIPTDDNDTMSNENGSYYMMKMYIDQP
jgi:ribosomal-protein-alanine N-acetyltransferase